MECTKCGSAMEEGYMIDKSQAAVRPARWVEGPPEPALMGGLRTSGKACFLAVTFRCVKCGYLESYATEPTDPPGFMTP